MNAPNFGLPQVAPTASETEIWNIWNSNRNDGDVEIDQLGQQDQDNADLNNDVQEEEEQNRRNSEDDNVAEDELNESDHDNDRASDHDESDHVDDDDSDHDDQNNIVNFRGNNYQLRSRGPVDPRNQPEPIGIDAEEPYVPPLTRSQRQRYGGVLLPGAAFGRGHRGGRPDSARTTTTTRAPRRKSPRNRGQAAAQIPNRRGAHQNSQSTSCHQTRSRTSGGSANRREGQNLGSRNAGTSRASSRGDRTRTQTESRKDTPVMRLNKRPCATADNQRRHEAKRRRHDVGTIDEEDEQNDNEQERVDEAQDRLGDHSEPREDASQDAQLNQQRRKSKVGRKKKLRNSGQFGCRGRSTTTTTTTTVAPGRVVDFIPEPMNELGNEFEESQIDFVDRRNLQRNDQVRQEETSNVCIEIFITRIVSET